MPTLRSGEVAIHYEVHGSGPAILFAHESTGHFENWRDQVEHFSRARTCITYNARGYPPSDVPRSPSDYSQAIFVADMLAVLDHLKVGKADIVGLSMGSMTALNFALRHRARTNSIVLAGTGPGQSREAVHAFRKDVASLADRLDRLGWNGILDEYDAAPDRREVRWKNPSLHKAYCDGLRARDSAVSAMILREVVMKRPVLADLGQELKRLDLPVLIVTGDTDPDCLPTSLFLRDTLPRAGLAILPRTGHAVNFEEPDLFNSLLDGFYASIAQGRW